MKTFSCTCGNRLFFDSTVCLKCQVTTGMCPDCRRVGPLVAADPDHLQCGMSDCGAFIHRCSNFAQNECNWCVPEANADAGAICEYCALTTVIPNLAVNGNRERWARLERAKRRVLYTLDEHGLPFRAVNPREDVVLSFKFKADGKQPAHTGHKKGCITINIREASDVEREKARVAFDEPKRTLVGHFRHELGHFFWDRLVKGQCEDEFRNVFGNERNPAYSDALADYHANGPALDWQKEFVSAYATAHPWEDFAETFRIYLEMISILDTAEKFNMAEDAFISIDAMISRYQEVGIVANEFNRDMGLLDLVPEVLVPPVIKKLQFVASLK